MAVALSEKRMPVDPKRVGPARRSSVYITAVDCGCSLVGSVRGSLGLNACGDLASITRNSITWEVRGAEQILKTVGEDDAREEEKQNATGP